MIASAIMARVEKKSPHTRAFCLLIIKSVALIAEARISNRQINTMS